jgi:hypothetical protein
MILIVLSLMAFFSTLTGGFFYYASQKESAFKEANKQAVLHIETIKRHLSYFASENMKSAKALAGLKELSNGMPSPEKTKTPWQRLMPFSIISAMLTRWMSVI